jgi:hypothetical protein
MYFILPIIVLSSEVVFGGYRNVLLPVARQVAALKMLEYPKVNLDFGDWRQRKQAHYSLS